MTHRRESTLLAGRAGPALSVDVFMLMPAFAPATRRARDEVKFAICLTIGVCAGNKAPLPS
jgi:hypothetical protein